MIYIRTDNGKKIEASRCPAPYVEPLAPNSWCLCIQEKHGETPQRVPIAVFETVHQANVALDDLRDAIEKEHGWDAIEYKEKAETRRKRLTSQK